MWQAYCNAIKPKDQIVLLPVKGVSEFVIWLKWVSLIYFVLFRKTSEVQILR